MNKKFALGKGLGALIPDEINEDNEGKLMISLNKIKSNIDQPRKSFDNEKIAELAESIKNHGIIQPLILKENDGGYIIVAGERRWRAAKMVGLKEVPAIVMDLTEKQVLEISLIENILPGCDAKSVNILYSVAVNFIFSPLKETCLFTVSIVKSFITIKS